MSDATDLVPSGDNRNDPRFPKPELASEAAKKAAQETKHEDLARILICGDFGGLTRTILSVQRETEDGEDDYETEEQIVVPCSRPSSFGVPGARYGITPGRCFMHLPERLEAVAQRKAKFLDTYVRTPENGIKRAAEATHIEQSTIYWWREHDPEFRRNMDAIKEIAQAILTDQVEEMVHQAIQEWRPGAGVLAQWYLANRRGEKWKSMGKTSGDGTSGTPSVNISGGQHVWKIGDHEERM